MRKLLFIFFFVCGVAHGQSVFNAADCTTTQVGNAFSAFVAANPASAIINIPACSGGISWASTVTLTIPSGNLTLVIQGQSTVAGTCGPGGTCTATDTTKIVDGLSSAAPLLIIATGASNTSLRLTGISMFTSSPQGIKPNGLINIAGNSQSLRIDHNHISDLVFGSLDFDIHGWQYGVADHNLFDNGTAMSPVNGQGIHIDMEGYNGGQWGHKSWADTTQFGSGHAFFIENNAFNYGNYINDCQQGAREVIRYNLILEAPAQTHPTHGNTGRTCRSTEYYHNQVDGTNGFVSIPEQFFWLSGGTLLIWGNTGPTGYKNVITVHSMRRDNSTYNEAPTPTGWGYCGTSSGLPGAGSAWDQNSPATTGFRCLDQPAVGVGDELAGALPLDGGAGVLNTTTGTIAWPHQALEPIYEWLDSWAAVPGYPGAVVAVSSEYTQNVDYYVSSNPGSGANCTGFTGATDVGCGLLSARPANCTAGVAYWGTDTNTLYKCTVTGTPGTWASYYIPYTYPHPLDTTAGTVTISPTSLLGGTVGVVYSQTLTASGGVAPYTWTLFSGSLPAGTVILNSSTGVISGTPSTASNYSFTIHATDSTGGTPLVGSQSYSITISPSGTPQNTAPANGVQFLGQNSPQPGNWIGDYGKDGYWIPSSVKSIPAYAVVTPTNANLFVFDANPTDPRALQLPTMGRFSSCWYTPGTMAFDVNLTDGKTHKLSLYMTDYNTNNTRAQKLVMSDALSGKVLDTESLSNFTNGVYYSWNCTGHLKLSVTSTGQWNALVSGIFFN